VNKAIYAVTAIKIHVLFFAHIEHKYCCLGFLLRHVA